MQEKPRVGLVLMRSGSVCCEEPGEFLKAIHADEQSTVSRLAQYLQILGPWIIDSLDSLQECQAGLRDNELDMVVVAFQTEAEDGALDGLLDAIGDRPLVIWCYLPWQRLPRPASYSELQRTTGLVGAFAALGALHNLGADFLFTFGAPEDPRLIRDLQVTGRAALLRRKLRSTRIGVLPTPTRQARSSVVDEPRLMADIGPVVKHLPVEAFHQAAAAVSPAAVSAYLAQLRERFQNSGVSEETLAQGARAALGLAALAAQHKLDVLALDDASPELLRAFGLRPALYPDLAGDSTVLYQPEADLGAAAANYILHHLTGSATMFLELLFWDEALNQVVGGHGGLQNPANADPHGAILCRDYGCCPLDGADGVQLPFLAREGRVTLLQVRATPSGWQAIALSGVCVEGLPWLEGMPHAILRLDATVEHFLNRAAEVGVAQHWVMAYGSVLHEIEAFCRMEKIPVEVLSY